MAKQEHIHVGDVVYHHQHRAKLARVLLITRSDNPLANLQWLSDGARTYRVPLRELRRLNEMDLARTISRVWAS